MRHGQCSSRHKEESQQDDCLHRYRIPVVSHRVSYSVVLAAVSAESFKHSWRTVEESDFHFDRDSLFIRYRSPTSCPTTDSACRSAFLRDGNKMLLLLFWKICLPVSMADCWLKCLMQTSFMFQPSRHFCCCC